MAEQPTGTVTLLFSDIEGSTRLLEWLGPDRYGETLELQRRVLRRAFSEQDGFEVDCEGDAFFIAFARAQQALSAAAAAQDALSAVEWPEGVALRVRIGIHTGEPLAISPRYVGLDVHKAARIMAAGHGGQVVVSQATRELASNADLRDLGLHRLKDLAQPERLYQLGQTEFPPLRSLNRTNLPLATGPLLGRDAELARIQELLTGGSRLLTLTGPGGSGKTRLALQAAAELVDAFPDGVFFVALAPLGAAAAAPGAVAQALGLRPDDDLQAYLGSRRLLLVLDNAEHLAGIEELVADLLCGDVVVLVTSRSPLHLSAELELAVEPLAGGAAAELFSLRAAAVGRSVAPDDTIIELCRRLDNLPLAVELAAARAKLLAPRAILERLEQALPFLTGGPRDAPERQQTLRATIEWSHELLSEAERFAFRRLAVFRGSFTLDPAEAVAGADLDTVAALVDKSLLKPIDDQRVLMLETIREFALEQLEAADETAETLLRHGCWYEQRVLELAPEREGPRAAEILAWYAAETANMWAALDTLLSNDAEQALAFAAELGPFWVARGQIEAGRKWMQRAIGALEPGKVRARDYQRLGQLTLRAGNLGEADAAFERAIGLAKADGDAVGESKALDALSHTAYYALEHDRAAIFAERAVAAAEQSGDPIRLAESKSALAVALMMLDRLDPARSLLEDVLRFFEETRHAGGVALAEINLAEIELREGSLAAAGKHAQRALEIHEGLAHSFAAYDSEFIGTLHLAGDRPDDALVEFGKALEASAAAGDATNVLVAAVGIATAAWRALPGLAAQIWAAAESKGIHASGIRREQSDRAMSAVRAALGQEGFDREVERGRALSLDETVELAQELARLATTREVSR
jgi:predicted ATPase/class 3 adenylate cyclase